MTENATPPAAPAEGAPPSEAATDGVPPAPGKADLSPFQRAEAALLAGAAAQAASEPPAEGEQPLAEPQLEAPPADAPPSAADALLSGTPIPAKEEPLDGNDPSLAKVVEMDQRLRARELELQTTMQAIEAQKADAARMFEAQTILKNGGSKLQALKALNLTYEDLTAEVLRGEGGSLSPATEEIAELKGKLEQIQADMQQKVDELTKARDAEKQRRDAAELARWDAKASAEIAHANEKDGRWDVLSDPFALAMMKTRMHADSAPEAIRTTIHRHWAETGGEQGGEMLTVAQAADMLSVALEREMRTHVSNAAFTRRIMGAGAPPVPPTIPAPSADAEATNGLSASNITTAAAEVPAGDPPVGSLSREEKRRRSAEAILKRSR